MVPSSNLKSLYSWIAGLLLFAGLQSCLQAAREEPPVLGVRFVSLDKPLFNVYLGHEDGRFEPIELKKLAISNPVYLPRHKVRLYQKERVEPLSQEERERFQKLGPEAQFDFFTKLQFEGVETVYTPLEEVRVPEAQKHALIALKTKGRSNGMMGPLNLDVSLFDDDFSSTDSGGVRLVNLSTRAVLVMLNDLVVPLKVGENRVIRLEDSPEPVIKTKLAYRKGERWKNARVKNLVYYEKTLPTAFFYDSREKVRMVQVDGYRATQLKTTTPVRTYQLRSRLANVNGPLDAKHGSSQKWIPIKLNTGLEATSEHTLSTFFSLWVDIPGKALKQNISNLKLDPNWSEILILGSKGGTSAMGASEFSMNVYPTDLDRFPLESLLVANVTDRTQAIWLGEHRILLKPGESHRVLHETLKGKEVDIKASYFAEDAWHGYYEDKLAIKEEVRQVVHLYERKGKPEVEALTLP